MPRSVRLFLEDMQDAAQKVQRYTQGLNFEAFRKHEQVVDATLHNLQIIGEAAKNIPAEVREQHAAIPWRSLARFRDVLAHHYFGIRLETVWDVVKNEIPVLLPELQRAIEQTEEGRPQDDA